MPGYNETASTLDWEDLQEDSTQCQPANDRGSRGLQLEIERLTEENQALRRCLRLVKENASLRTANIIANVISWSDDQLSNYLSRMFPPSNDLVNRNVVIPGTSQSPFRPISPSQSNLVTDIVVKEPSGASMNGGHCPYSRQKSFSPVNNTSRNQVNSGQDVKRRGEKGMATPNEQSFARSPRNVTNDFEHSQTMPKRFPDSSDADERWESMLMMENIPTKASVPPSNYNMPSYGNTTSYSDRRSADRNRGMVSASEGYASQIVGVNVDVSRDSTAGNERLSPNGVPSTRSKHREERQYNDKQLEVKHPVIDANTTRDRKRVGDPIATSTPVSPKPKSAQRTGDWQRAFANLQNRGSNPPKSSDFPGKSILSRTIDSVIGVKSSLTDERRQKLMNIKPSSRIIGEIAFQLDRRILEYVFSDKYLQNKEGRRKRYYGFSIPNIGELIRKEATDENGSLVTKKELELRYRFDYVRKSLSAFGYNLEKHAQFTQDMVNKYGLLSGPPDKSKAKQCGLDDPVILRVMLSQIMHDETELADELIVLDCLCLLAHDDQKELFRW